MMDEPGPLNEEELPLNEEELLERLQEEMRKITVPDYLAHLLVSLSSMAFQRLGLTHDTVADRDLSQSRMAIDAFEALAKVLSTKLGEQETAMYRSTVHQMRMAYLRAADPGAGRVETGESDAAASAAGAGDTDAEADATHIGAADMDDDQTGSPVEEKE